ncbi:MAG: UTP--glucose-1-phosphate uridylyltransferase GalU [Myxococcales bacterium]|nr:UTP--glucose-1-phosphate uridylyltransferase GalU [Myxococcales bacterium]
MKVRKAIIPAAGLGTRFLPASKAIPKEMLPIVDTPIIQYIVAETVRSGIEDVILIQGRGKGAIEDHFDYAYELEDTLRAKKKTDLLRFLREIDQMTRLIAVRQGKALGLGHAVLQARDLVGNEPFAVLLGDDVIDAEVPVTLQLIQAAQRYGGGVIGIREVAPEETRKYGILKGAEIAPGVVRIDDMVEKPEPSEAPSRWAVMGRYVLPPEIFDILESTKPGKGGEIQLTDGLSVLARQQPMFGYIFKGDQFDAGDKLGFLRATIHFALKREDFREPLLAYMREVLNAADTDSA